MIKFTNLRYQLDPVPHQIGAEVDPPPIMSAHARKERHMFAHHREIVARIMEVKNAVFMICVIIVFMICGIIIVIVIIWKQVHANGCAVGMCFCIFGQRWNAIQ